MRRLRAGLAAAGLVSLALSVPASAATIQASMKDNVFLPAEITIAPGDTITWTNDGRSPHNVTAGDRSRASGTIEPGATASMTFPTAQTFFFYCDFHATGTGNGMSGVVRVGSGGPVIGAPKVGGTTTGGGPRVIKVPADQPTIQKAVDAAHPGDAILISPGIYKEAVKVTTDNLIIRGVDRNTVIIDGEFTRAINVLVQGADNVVIENLTARYATLNNVYWTDVDGYRGSFLTSYNSGDYGIYSFNSVNGVMEDSWASGSRDSGFYIGQCKPCHQVIRRIKATNNGLGYSGTNAGGDLLIADSEWWDNYGGGITPNTLDSEENPPQSDVVITGNYVHGNQNTNAPYKDPAFASVYGVGIAVMGGENNTVTNNRVEDHEYFGILVQPIPGIGGDAFVTGNFYPAPGNRIEKNQVSGSGLADLALGAPAGAGNCFGSNSFGLSLPALIEQTYGCGMSLAAAGGGDAVVSGVIASNLARAEAGELAPGDWKTQPLPPPQPNMNNPTEFNLGSAGGGTVVPPPAAAPVVHPRTGAGRTVPVGLAALAISVVWAGLRSVRRRTV